MPHRGALTSPIALPRSTWKGTLARTAVEFKHDKLNHWGAALTYYAVLSLFPALLVLVSLVGLFASPERVTKVLTDTVSQLGPASAAKTFQGPIESITANRGTAGVMFVVGVLSALWAASGYVSAFADASNTIYEVDEGRPFWKLKPLQVVVTFVLIVLASLVALALVLSGPIVGALGASLGISDMALTAWRLAKWPAMVILVLVIFGALYYTSPNARVSGVRWVTGGALLALALWVLASIALALYVANFGSYDKTYGTLGGVVVFLVWLWVTNMAILLGAEFNAETERARQIETGVPGAEDDLKLQEREPARAE
ncbi:YihY/virulence factor BrkB family protein [Candidatus Solirubrobacter pratensis]|uniref:YihY/virulence factor BrkB family protein n=1 Tax=Candidatus Solirubrobacter pratensis TaxID=1298857 RepID=UPI00042202B8|nr:YihY/virulence factor BrkB family protein [Candidatus Solirubrobacter pratensis]